MPGIDAETGLKPDRRRKRLRHVLHLCSLYDIAAALRHRCDRLQPLALLVFMLSLCAAESATEQGIAAFHRGAYAEAARELQQAVSQDPHDQHARAFLAFTRAATGHCADAIPDLSAQ